MKLFVEDLTHVDFTYLDAKRGLVGESWIVDLTLDGLLNDEGMIVDFGVVKKRVKQWFDEGLDHSLVLAEKMENLSISHENAQLTINWRYPTGECLSCSAPQQAFAIVPVEQIEPLSVARWCEQAIKALFPNVQGISVTLRPELIQGAFYHYTHGLSQHKGNCQRIAHGHRSSIEIRLDDKRNAAIESQWASLFKDIYIGSDSHLQRAEAGMSYFAYDAPQGAFSLSLPSRYVYMIDTESTVELIAQHIAKEVATQCPTQNVEVRAFEGVKKGAIATFNRAGD